MASRIGMILLEFLVAVMLVFYFAGFGGTGWFTGAAHQSWLLLVNTFSAHLLRENYAGVSWPSLFVSFRLIVVGTVFSCLFGFAHAVASARLKSRVARGANEFVSTLFQSLPEAMYVVLIFVILVFLLKHGINIPGLFHDGIPRWQDTFAPAIALGLPGALYLRRVLFNRLVDENQAMYVYTAVSKGLSEKRTFYTHILPNALPMAFRQIPVVAGLVISSALFAEFFLGYMGVLFRFTTFVGWDMNSGPLGMAKKQAGLPTYQPGAVFLVGLLLVISWLLFRLVSEALSFWFPQDIEPASTMTQHKTDVGWILAGIVLILVVIVVSLFPTWLTHNNPNTKHLIDTTNWTFPPYPPSHAYPLGTDAAGRDLLAQTLHGTFTSLRQVVAATGLVVMGSLLVATIAMFNLKGWFSQVVLRLGRVVSAVPVLLIVFLAVYDRNILSHYQELQFICWIALFEIGRGSISFYSAMVEWNEFGFIEGATSIGQRRMGILYRQLRSWLGQFTLEFAFAEFTRVLSLMTLLAMLHSYAVDQPMYLNGTPPVLGIGSGQMTWFSILGDAANQVFSIITHPFLIYAPALALLFTMLGASFIARGLRGDRSNPRSRASHRSRASLAKRLRSTKPASLQSVSQEKS